MAMSIIYVWSMEHGVWSITHRMSKEIVGEHISYSTFCQGNIMHDMILPALPGQYYSYIVRSLLHEEIFMNQRGPRTIVATGNIYI